MTTPLFSLKTLLITTILMGAALLSTKADTYSWDDDAGGSGTWQNGTGGTTWKDLNSNTTGLDWDNSQQNNALFRSSGGTVTVNGTVSTNYLHFEGGDYILNGGTIAKNANTSDNYGESVELNSNNNVTINSNITLDTGGNTDRFNIVNNGTGTLTINGNITYVTSAGANTNNRSLIISGGTASSVIVLNGTFSLGSSGNIGSIRFSEGSSDQSTLHLNGDYSGLNTGQFLDHAGGNVVLGTSLTGTGGITMYSGMGYLENSSILTSGAQTIANSIYITKKDSGANAFGSGTLGGSTADLSTYTGVIGLDNSGVTVTAVAGGRVNFTNNFNGHSPTGIIKTGDGIVELSDATGITNYLGNDFGATGTVAVDIQAGKFIISNTSNSGFGNNAGTVQIHANAALGGTGYSNTTQMVVSQAATSIIAPGETGTIGTLHAIGGLTAASGLTFQFDLGNVGGTTPVNDVLDLGGAGLTLSGPVTFDFNAVSALVTGQVYTLLTGTGGTWNATGTTFTFNNPNGYLLDTSYGTNGYLFDATNHTLSVEFAAAPEPGTWAMLFISLALLGLVHFRRSRSLC